MKKELFYRIAILALCAAMVLALFACEGGEAETEPATDPVQTDPTETDPIETDPIETDPTESDPADTTPADTDPADTDPADTDPADTDPADTDPTDTDPADTDPTDTDPEETDPEETDPEYEKAEEVKADVDYYLAFDHKASNKVRFFDGRSDDVYPLSSDSIGGAERVRLEATNGGYYLYFVKNASKVYVNVSKVYTFVSLSLESEAKTVYSFNEALSTLTVNVDGKDYFLGAYGDYTYFSLSEMSYAADSYVAYFVEAECDHTYVADDNGHALLACAKCGTAAGAVQAHGETISVSEPGKRTSYCKDCGYVLSIENCDQFHWLSDADGHWEGACAICGTPDKSAVKKAHSDDYKEYVTDTTYSLGCSICGYAHYTKELTGVSYMITPYTWGIKATTYYQLNNGKSYGWFYYENGDIPYGQIKGSDKISQILFNRSYSDTTNTSSNQQYLIEVGNAKYLLMKIRTDDNTQPMQLTFSTTGKNGMKSLNLPISMLKNGEWGIIAIDLAATFGEHYAKDAEKNEYIVDSFYFTMNTFASTNNIDVAYMAFFEGNFSDIINFVDEEEAILNSGSLVAWKSLIPGACEGEHAYGVENVNGTCKYKCTICGVVGEAAEHNYASQVVNGVCTNKCTVCGTIGDGIAHTYATQVVDGYYVGACDKCGDKKSYGVKAEEVNYFISPDRIKTSGGQGSFDKTLMDEDGVSFLRIDNFKVTSWGGVNFISSDVGVTGQYLVMKIRLGENGLGQSYLDIYANCTSGTTLVADMLAQFKVVEDGEWHLVVIDLSKRVADPETYMQPANDGYHLNFLQIRPFAGKQTATQPDDYMDIAFIALFDDINDLKNIVDDATYEWSVSKTVSEIRKTSDHSCALHSPGTLTTSTDGDGNTIYSALCTICGEDAYKKVVPASVTEFYTGAMFATSGKVYVAGSNGGGKGTVEYDADNCIIFGRESGNVQFIYHRAQVDMEWNTRSQQTTTMDVGNARFLVIRLRTSSNERTLSLMYSTAAKNSPLLTATEEIPDKRGIDGEKGISVGEQYAKEAGYTGLVIPTAVAVEGEWTTYVIDLNAVAGEYHAKVEGEDSYVVDTFYFNSNGKPGTLDVEYMAFVEGDWSDVAELVGAGDVINITNKSGTYENKTLS